MFAVSFFAGRGEVARAGNRRQPAIRIQAGGRRCRRLLERGPAAVFFVTTSPDLAGIVQQALSDVLPDRRLSVEPDGVGLLDFDDPGASGSRTPSEYAGKFRTAAAPGPSGPAAPGWRRQADP